jgi:hypothetical protein
MMSSKISQVYYLMEYSFGRTIQIWPKLRYRAISANAVSTPGFHAKEMMRNPRFAQSANRLTGIRRASRIAKRQSGARTGLYACKSTMTMIKPSERRTIMVTVCARLIRATEASFLGFYLGKEIPLAVLIKRGLSMQQKRPLWVEVGVSLLKQYITAIA